MPALITHDIFGRRVLARLSPCAPASAAQAQPDAFRMGLQGPDLMSYNVFLLVKKGNGNLGGLMHQKRTRQFLMSAQQAASAGGQDQPVRFAYLCGFFCHYVCDSICHPFVYARTGYDPARAGARYYGRHCALEGAIDDLYARRDLRLPAAQIDQSRIFAPPQPVQKQIAAYLAQVFDDVYGDLFGRRVSPALFERTMQMAARELRLLRDPDGKKQRAVAFLERIAPGYPLLSVKFVTGRPCAMDDPLNTRHSLWRNPFTGAPSHQSFDDLFDRAVALAVSLLPLLTDPQRLFDLLDDTPYNSGSVLRPGAAAPQPCRP